MAKKSSPRKSLKSLFSKSEANLDESVEKDANKHEGEKKKFKLFKFKTKAKSDSASEKSAGGSQLVLSANEPNNTAEDGDAWPDITVSANKKKSSFFGTTPRSKGREFSYSELDLRKPSRKFATFSLGLRKKKKRDDDNISKSTFGLHSPGIEEQEETPLDLSQMESDQTNTKKMFSMSQPELDTSDTFDIPSPPPVAANQSYFTTSQSQLFVATNMQPESKESLTGSNLSDVGVCSETPKAPIASIPELLLDDENAHILVYDNSSRSEDKSPVPATHIETISVVDNQTAPRPSASQPPNVLDTSIYKACDNDIFQQPDTKSEISLTKSTSPTLSNHQPPVPDRADRMTTSDEPSLTSVGSKTDATIAESACVSHCANDNSALSSDSAAIHEDISISCTERSVPEAAKSVTASSTVNSEKSLRPHSEDVVYGALYDSLLPKSFISELMSSLLNPPTQICSETTYLKARSEPVMVKTLDEWQTETNVMYSCVSSSQDISASKENDTENSIPNNFKVASTSENSSFNSQHHSSTSLQTDMDVHHKYLPTSLSSATESAGNHVPDSELTRPHSQIKSKSISPIHNTVGSLPVVQNSAPPISECMMSHGTNTQVTGSKRRVILVKQLDTDEGNAVSGYHSWASRKMSATNSPEMKNDTTDFFYVASGSGLSDGSERPLSPPYLSMGSDDGSIMEVYYSAQEDNTEESGEEEMNTTNERQDICVVDDVREMEWREIEETGKGSKDKGSLGIVIVKMEKEGGKIGKEEKNEDPNSQTEVQQQQGGQMAEAQVHQAQVSDFLTSSDANNPEEETTTTALPQMKEEGEERRMEELVATPVQQVNTVMVCEVVPPSSEPHRQGEGSEENWTEHLKRQDHLIGDQEIQYQNLKEIRSSEYEQTAFINAPEVNVIEPTWGQAKEQIQLTADKREEPSKESTETDSKATTRAVTDAELQLDATEIEHNRTLQSSGWVDTITQSTDKERRVQEQVAVELSTLNAETHRSNTDPAEPERHEHPTGAHPDSDRGSPTVSGSNIAAFEVFASESQQTNTDQELLDKMSSGYSSLSTRLTLRNISPPEEDDSKFQNRFHKMSLITEVDGLRKDTEDSNTTRSVTTVTESNGTNIEPGYRWRNKFEGVTQYKQQTPEDSSSDSLSYSVSDTYSSTSTLSSSGFPEATAYKPLSDTYSSPTLGDRLRTAVYVSHESEPAAEQKDEWRRSLVIQEEPSAPAGEREGQREGEAESVRIQSRWDTQQHPVSSFSSTFQTGQTEALKEGDNNESTEFSGLFKATLVELVSDPAAPPSTPPASPDAESSSQFEMDSLVDTLKSMGPAHRPRSMGLRPHTQTISSLPPIDEDAFSPATSDGPGSLTSPSKTGTVNGFCSLPADLGLGRNTNRDSRSPLQLMKQGLQEQQLQPGTRGLNMPLRASATSSIVMKTSSDTTEVLNGNGVVPNTGSRLDNSVIFGSYRPLSIDQSMENGKTHRSVFRTSSLPETGLSNDRISKPKEPGDVAGSRFDRFSFLLNSSSSSSGSLTGVDDPRMSRAPSLGMTSPPSSNSPTRILSPTGSIDLHRSFTTTDSPLSFSGQTQGMGMGLGTGTMGTPILQRSFSSDSGLSVNSMHGGPHFQSREPEPDKNLALKYRAFPDAYLTKEKEHGKLNPRPGKMYIFDRPGMCGQRTEVRSDVVDATSWDLQETISINVIRGGWVLYEKPNFKGEKIALDEGELELTYPFSIPEEGQQQQQNGQQQNGETSHEQTETKPAKKFIIGSIRRAVRDYSVPEISLFPEENAEGKKVVFRDTCDDARIYGLPIKANSIIINAGLWLVFAEPFFQGLPRVLEVGGYTNPAAWGVEQPYVGSLVPLKVGEPKVENISEPKMVIYDKPYFSGKPRTITTNMRDFITRVDRQQTVFMHNVGSLKVLGGIWVGYEKEGFRGRQYLLEEGEYHDWRVWGGCDSELRSVRVIRADLTDPLMVMFEQPEEDGDGVEEKTFEVTEAIPDVELFQYKTSTRSIQVVSGAWIAYSHVDFSGNQYILEKGFYNNCADWGSQDTRICSVQPILMAPSVKANNEIILYSEPDFQGECHFYDRNQDTVQQKFLTKSCRVVGVSWVAYENEHYTGNMYVLSSGDYPNLTSMGCPNNCPIRSLKVIPVAFSIPSISLFGLEGLEGREITAETEIFSMAEVGYDNHILSVRVNSGCWVICEYSNYRGRQFLLEPIEIPNWPKFSSLQTIGSMYPVRQKRQYFRIKNKERGHFMSVQGGVEEMKSGRVVVTETVEPMSDTWYYEDGLIKNKLSPSMSLQVMGNIEPAAKVVLWTETREPTQTWTFKMRGLITSLTFPGIVIDVKGGKVYDKDHVVIMQENDERPSQQWEIELL